MPSDVNLLNVWDEGYMSRKLVKSGCALLGLFASSCLVFASPAAAHEDEGEWTDPIAVCPDGGYESGCSQEDVDRAVSLSNDYLMTLRNRCLYQTKARCWVLASGHFNAMERGGPVSWQHVTLQPLDGPSTEMMILIEGASQESVTLVAAKQVFGYFGSPEMVENSDEGVLIHVAGRRGGSGSGNSDFLLLREKSGWSDIAMDAWMDQANKALPSGFDLRQGVQFNFREMFVSSPVWREDDGNCCATGGRALIDLAISDGTLTVENLTFQETRPAGASDVTTASESPE